MVTSWWEIITETDVFCVLVELLGGHEESFRFTLRVPDEVGRLSAITNAIANAGGNIVAVTGRPFSEEHDEVMIKETGADPTVLKEAIQDLNVEIRDMRSSYRYQPRLFG